MTVTATARGVARTTIFLNDDEHRLFLRLFADIVGRYDWQVHVFCLMPNHYHLVLETTVERLSAGMHALNGRHARQFNERHGRSGHLFQKRFDARIIDRDRVFRRACEYVVENPVRAGLAQRSTDWPWGSAATSP